ncbi:MAG: universal stress protein [Chloroflexi bacterium]|nr:universal stress protein [Chloroflexota bacterium]MBI3734397.1 universal stress protein [Chloroflexota bacterium]
MFKKIMVPLDGSELAEAVLPYVRALAATEGAEVILLRVLVYAIHDFAGVDPTFSATIAEANEAVRQGTEKYLRELTARLSAQGLNVSALTADGLVAEAILDCADKTGADLIAMSTHGRSGLARWLIGSVADRVVRGSKVPVLLIRPTGHPASA